MTLLSLAFASPVYFNSHLHIPVFGDSSENGENGTGGSSSEEDFWSRLVFCIEDWNFEGRKKKT